MFASSTHHSHSHLIKIVHRNARYDIAGLSFPVLFNDDKHPLKKAVRRYVLALPVRASTCTPKGIWTHLSKTVYMGSKRKAITAKRGGWIFAPVIASNLHNDRR